MNIIVEYTTGKEETYIILLYSVVIPDIYFTSVCATGWCLQNEIKKCHWKKIE